MKFDKLRVAYDRPHVPEKIAFIRPAEIEDYGHGELEIASLYAVDPADGAERAASQRAYANLFAAAPELLEALLDLRSSIGGGRKFCGHDYACVCAWDKSTVAIAKVEARSLTASWYVTDYAGRKLRRNPKSFVIEDLKGGVAFWRGRGEPLDPINMARLAVAVIRSFVYAPQGNEVSSEGYDQQKALDSREYYEP